MSQHFDYYGEARSISQTLKKHGHKKWGDLILDKIAAGSTSTEILMGIRWALQEGLNSRQVKTTQIERMMLALVAKIDGALK